MWDIIGKIKEYISISDILTVIYFCSMIPLLVYIYMFYNQIFFLVLIVIIPLTIFLYLPIPGITARKAPAEKTRKIYGAKEQLDKIAPESVTFYSDYIKLDNGYIRMLYPKEYPPQAFPGWLANYTASGHRIGIVQHITQMDRTLAIEVLNKIILKKHGALTTLAQGHPYRPSIEQTVASDEQLRDKLIARQSEVFKTGIYFMLYADSKKELDALTTEFASQTRGEGLPLAVPTVRTLEAFYTAAPRNLDMLKKWREMDTSALATTFFYVRNTFGTEKGVLFGFSPMTYQPIIIDRFDKENVPSSHTIVCGFTGAGKSLFCKVVIIYRTKLYYPDIQILIIDPTAEYAAITELLGGQVVRIGTPEGIINPFDFKTVIGRRSPLLEKIQEVGTFFDMMYQLTPTEKAIITKTLPELYEHKGITIETNPETFTGESPIFSDFAKELKTYKEAPETTMEAKIATSNLLLYIDPWINGALRMFNQQTNVEITKDTVSFDISELADMEELFTPLMRLVMNYVDARVKANPAQKKLVVIDECHRVMDNEDIRMFIKRMVKEYRKFSTGAVLLSQSAEDFLKYPEGEEIFRMAYFNLMLWHKEVGKKTLEVLNLTQPELEIILAKPPKGAAPRDALFISGTSKTPVRIIAFDHEYPFATSTPDEVAKLKAEGAI